MTAYFLGGASGSGLSAAIYASHGWAGVCVLGAAFPAAGLLLWVIEMLASRRASARRAEARAPAVQD
ncbi:hypothetical protein ABGB18_46265 [Nonomuraea sp. B12E4]|uniref:hypothetical protein n=1 Tax=Nonomuraea sp. B12E4 TaxID=3153564 RepID=UPI00325EF01E